MVGSISLRRRAAIVAAAAAILVALWYGGGERSAWILSTRPDIGHGPLDFAVNTLLGYTGIADGAPLHRENFYTFHHIAMFLGGAPASDMYMLRPIFPLLASTFVPIFGWKGAMIALNVVAWAVATFITHRFTRLIAGETAALWAALFCAGGMGFVVHVHDYSAHLLAFTVYYTAVYFVYRSNVWAERTRFSTHMALSAFFCVAALEYNTGLLAAAGYAATALPKNGVARVAVGALPAFAISKAWPYVLNFMSGQDVDYGATERWFRDWSYQIWATTFENPIEFAKLYATTILNFMSYDMPLSMSVGAAGLAWLLYKKRNANFALFCASMFAMPILAIALYAGPYTSKGYLSFQTSIFLYLGIGVVLTITKLRPAAVAMAGLLLAMHYAWSFAYLAGFITPLKLYFAYGFQDLFSALSIDPRPLAWSLTGHEPTPALFGGSFSLSDAGMATCANSNVIDRSGSYLRSLTARIPLGLLILVAAMLLARTRLVSVSANKLATLSALFVLMPGALNAWTNPSFLNSSCPIPGRDVTGSSFEFSIDVSREFRSQIELARGSTEIEILHGLRLMQLSKSAKARLNIGNHAFDLTASNSRGIDAPFVPKRPMLYVLEYEPFIEALREANNITLVVSAPPGTYFVEGWQGLLPGRVFKADGSISDFSPSFEIRIRDTDNPMRPLRSVGF